jgi:hypothetical protein
MLDWLAKAKKVEKRVDQIEDDENNSIQGSYTDHHRSPYQRRMELEPMHGDELEQFNRACDKLGKKYDTESLKDIIEYGMDDGWFKVDKNGMLRVNMELPE